MLQLQKMLENEPNDPFLLYGIAMEHKKAGAFAEALAWLGRTVETDAAYAYAHFQTGLVHEELGDTTAAAEAYRRGISAAESAGDAHARDECQAALDMLG
ncbi:MAG: hypothetical protein ACFCVE_10335 [Phycisphaerae bacterium]